MYCSNCGKSINDNLNYCNSCGARIEKNPLVVSNAASPQLAKSLTVIAMIGLIGFVGVLKVLLDNGRLDTAAVIVILVAYLTTLFLICGMIVGHLWKHSGDIRIKAKETADPPNSVRGGSLTAINTAQLEEHREPVMSVTEHTTRTLENVPVERH